MLPTRPSAALKRKLVVPIARWRGLAPRASSSCIISGESHIVAAACCGVNPRIRHCHLSTRRVRCLSLAPRSRSAAARSTRLATTAKISGVRVHVAALAIPHRLEAHRRHPLVEGALGGDVGAGARE